MRSVGQLVLSPSIQSAVFFSQFFFVWNFRRSIFFPRSPQAVRPNWVSLVARPRSGFYLRNEFRAAGVRFYLHKRLMAACFNQNLLSKMGAVVNTISALRACSSDVTETNWVDLQRSMIDAS